MTPTPFFYSAALRQGQTLKRSARTIWHITVLLLIPFFSNAQKKLPHLVSPKDFSRDYKPFRFCGNLYYVGTYDLACYLITTPRGHILINTGLPESVGLIRSHIKALGFRFSDIKILLASHAHFDHVGGMAAIKKLTGAKLMIQEEDAPVLADGGNSDFLFGGRGSLFAPVRVDSSLHDRDTVKWGGMEILVLHHPGHTKGACSFLFDVNDGNRTYRVLIASMPTILQETKLSGMPAYPGVGEDYAYTLGEMKKLQFDIWFAAHASQFELHRKHQPDDQYNPEAFNDRPGYDSAINALEKEYLKRLAGK